jgi:hypothetical protein
MKSISSLLKLFPTVALFAVLMLSSFSRAQTSPPSWSSTKSYVAGDTVQLGGNTYRAIQPVAAGKGDPTTNYGSWELNYVRNNTTLMIGVGQTFPTLTAAWTYLLNARVADGAYVHLYISSQNGDFIDSLPSSFVLDHAYGPRIAILGDNESNDFVSFSNATNGFVIDTGHSFNTISGITISEAKTPNASDGIRAESEGTISALANIDIGSFTTGIHVSEGASISLSSNIGFFNIGTQVCLAESSASIVLNSAVSLNQTNTGGAYGFVAQVGGVIYCQGAITLDGFVVGVEALDEGNVYLDGATIQGCSDYGVLAENRGMVTCIGGSFTGNGIDLVAQVGGFIWTANSSFGTDASLFGTDGSYIYT